MFSKFFFLLIIIIPKAKSKIQQCTNTTTDIMDVCTLSNIYDPALPSEPWPIFVKVYINILDIVDIDWTSSTVTQIIQLWSFWNDTRISLTKIRKGYCYDSN